jgi:hypothetical protein
MKQNRNAIRATGCHGAVAAAIIVVRRRPIDGADRRIVVGLATPEMRRSPQLLINTATPPLDSVINPPSP